MSLPDLENSKWLGQLSDPGPYERGMGQTIAGLLRLFAPLVADRETNRLVLALAEQPDRWSAGHAVFCAVRERTLGRVGMPENAAQYAFEESCAQAVYNAVALAGSTWTNDCPPAFDPSAPFFIAPAALRLARRLGIDEDAVLTALGNHLEVGV
jgi:hypothetical protein